MRFFGLFTSLIILPTLVACSSQKDDTYAGDPKAQVQGVIEGDASAGGGVKVALFWNNFAKNGDTYEVTDAPVKGSFPATFTLDITKLPSTDGLNDFSFGGKLANESRVGVADIIAWNADVPVSADETIWDANLRGVAGDNVVVYVAGDVQPGTYSETFLGGPLKAGLHLMKVVRLSDEEKNAADAAHETCIDALPEGYTDAQYFGCPRDGTFDRLVEEPEGFSKQVVLKMGAPADLDYPNYT